MSRVVKPLANNIALTTANTVYDCKLVYISAATAALITVANSTVTHGSFVVPANQYVFVPKEPADTVAANVAVSASPAAYKG